MNTPEAYQLYVDARENAWNKRDELVSRGFLPSEIVDNNEYKNASLKRKKAYSVWLALYRNDWENEYGQKVTQMTKERMR